MSGQNATKPQCVVTICGETIEDAIINTLRSDGYVAMEAPKDMWKTGEFDAMKRVDGTKEKQIFECAAKAALDDLDNVVAVIWEPLLKSVLLRVESSVLPCTKDFYLVRQMSTTELTMQVLFEHTKPLTWTKRCSEDAEDDTVQS